ncbi:hypothetical protein [uncultured Ellagibacter sp.]|uniref:hypothetical protein n=1 Tax=uncultured Ellagibacter sp. TaxID=2137580 RepID=UPI0025D54C48|nr:hypothetical protein [uncultured Ellagibacter sp.]
MKKLIPVLLSLLMALAVAVPAFADTVYTEGALNYTIADESITITDYFGKDAEVTVPASIAGTPVNTIATGAFAHNDSVKKVNLPDTITTVEEGAFAAGITVNYQSNVVSGGTSIGEGDFAGSDSGGGSDSSTGIDETTVDADGSATSGSAAAADTSAASNPSGDAADSADAASESGSEKISQLDSSTEQEQGASFPWFWVALGIVVVVVCAAACLWLWRKRNR